MKKKLKFRVKLICEELEMEESCDFHSQEIEKMIETHTTMRRKVTVNDCNSSIILDTYEQWESKKITMPGKNGIEALAHFIHDTYNIPKKKGGEGFLTLDSIKSRLYEIKS